MDAFSAYVGDQRYTLYTINLGIDANPLVNVDCGLDGRLVSAEVLGASDAFASHSFIDGEAAGLLVATGTYQDLINDTFTPAGQTARETFETLRGTLERHIAHQNLTAESYCHEATCQKRWWRWNITNDSSFSEPDCITRRINHRHKPSREFRTTTNILTERSNAKDTLVIAESATTTLR